MVTGTLVSFGHITSREDDDMQRVVPGVPGVWYQGMLKEVELVADRRWYGVTGKSKQSIQTSITLRKADDLGN